MSMNFFNKPSAPHSLDRQYLKKAAAIVVKIVEQHLNHSSMEEGQLSTEFLHRELTQQLARLNPQRNLALDHLVAAFNLSEIEVFILLVCVATELSPTFKRLCAQYHGMMNQHRPTLSMISSLFADFDYEASLQSSPLFAWKLIETKDESNLSLNSSLEIELSILQYLMGTNYFDGRIKTMARYFPASQLNSSHQSEPLALNTFSSQVRQITTLYQRAKSEQYGAVVQITGTDLTNKENLVNAVTKELNCCLLKVSYFTLPSDADSLEELEFNH